MENSVILKMSKTCSIRKQTLKMHETMYTCTLISWWLLHALVGLLAHIINLHKISIIQDLTGQLLPLLYWYFKLSGNKIHTIPDSMCEMQSLRTLDVSSNLVTELPQHLCQVRTLDSLILDAPLMNNPPAGRRMTLVFRKGNVCSSDVVGYIFLYCDWLE